MRLLFPLVGIIYGGLMFWFFTNKVTKNFFPTLRRVLAYSALFVTLLMASFGAVGYLIDLGQSWVQFTLPLTFVGAILILSTTAHFMIKDVRKTMNKEVKS